MLNEKNKKYIFFRSKILSKFLSSLTLLKITQQLKSVEFTKKKLTKEKKLKMKTEK